MPKRRRKRETSRKREEPKSPPPPVERSFRIGGWSAVAAAAAIVLIGGLAYELQRPSPGTVPTAVDSDPPVANATFVGSQTCATCHKEQAALWSASQHRHAMDHATEETVLGDFNDVSFDYYDIQSRFFRKDGKFFVETDGPDGTLDSFEVKYTFGVDPLQQYLIEFPDGRLQALSIAWDSRSKEEGGQRWFHLYPNERIGHDDVLHWTKLNQNWNFMCAECHSTGLRKNYDAASDTFATSWAEISVGCETCHGAGSRHVAWAEAAGEGPQSETEPDQTKGLVVTFDERRGINWPRDAKTGLPARSSPAPLLRKEVETCGLCHARRAGFSEDWVPGSWLSDTHHVTLLNQLHFHADGQMRDVEETFNYGPFKQSKMFAAGVTCSDCHDPHSALLRQPGDGVCLTCHASETYQVAAHHHHDSIDPPLTCSNCHMPERTYMVIDKRHDHSFRIPRPDISARLGTPNACNDCHDDQMAQWAATAIERWFGPERKGFQSFADAFHTSWSDAPDSAALLTAIADSESAPGFVRASALASLGGRNAAVTSDLVKKGLSDPDPAVRIGTLDMLSGQPAAELWPLVAPLLSDPVRGVRIQAASLLASMPPNQQPEADRKRFKAAAEEFIAAQRLNADRPEARTTLGAFFLQTGRLPEAKAEFNSALMLSPQFTPAAINLADAHRIEGEDRQGVDVLQRALMTSPEDAGLHHALGLALVRLKKMREAVVALGRAAELAPDQARYLYVYAVGLDSIGRRAEALQVLKDNLLRHPTDRDTLAALISYNRAAGDFNAALDYAERLSKLDPNNADLNRLIGMLRRQVRQPKQ